MWVSCQAKMLPYSVGQLGQVISYIEHSISDPMLSPRSRHMNSLSLAEVQMKGTRLEVLMVMMLR